MIDIKYVMQGLIPKLRLNATLFTSLNMSDEAAKMSEMADAFQQKLDKGEYDK